MYPQGLAWFTQFVAYGLWQSLLGPIDCRPIVGGNVVQKTEISRYAYIVSLQDRIRLQNDTVLFKHFCGGSLISSSWILTAGHCVYHKKASAIVAAIGYEDLKVAGVDHRDIDGIRLKNFVPSTLKNDIALLRLKSPLLFGEGMVLGRVPERGIKTNPQLPCKIVGYGADKYGGKIQDKLHEGQVYIISRENCTSILGRIMAPQEGDLSLCGLGDLQDSCQGDSGGPLICSVNENNYIFGIVSHGLTCGQPGVPSIYTETVPYKKWIDGVINKN